MAVQNPNAVRVKVAERFSDDPWDREAALKLQMMKLLPAVENGRDVVFDFSGVEFLSQSFAGALVCELRKALGEGFSDRVEFVNTNPVLDSVLSLSARRSFGGYPG